MHEQRLAKHRKERKRKNEKKARDLLKLQLHMTAPEDLDNEDRALGGEDEVFDLGEGEREAVRQGRSTGLGETLTEADGMSEDDEEDLDDDSDDEVLDSDEERERKLGSLEGQLDGLYDEYKERMAERDAKWRVKNARAKDKNFDKWTGIGDDSDDDGVEKTFRAGPARAPRRGDADEEAEESDEGGWDLVAANKAKLGEEPDSSDESDDEDRPKVAKKEKIQIRVREAPAMSAPRGLVTSLNDKEERAQMSRQAQVWFDQSVFQNLGDLAALDGDDEEEEEDDIDMSEDEGAEGDSEEDVEDVDVEMEDGSEDGADDFEIVPVVDDNGPEWDVDDEDQDEVKKKIIQGQSTQLLVETTLISRQGSSHCRSCRARNSTGQPKDHRRQTDRRRIQPTVHIQQGRSSHVVPRRRVQIL